MSTNLMELSAQHASRRSEERFLSLPELARYQRKVREASREARVKLAEFAAAPVEGSTQALALLTPAGTPVIPTSWAFRQFCAKVGTPAGSLLDLPGDLAADVLNYRIGKYAGDQRAQMLVTGGAGAVDLRALTGEDYGRVWNGGADGLCEALIAQVGDGVTGDFRVPGIRGKALDKITKENTTIFGSDEDLYIMLADERNPVEMPGRRDGKPTRLHRGFIIQNSEVGKLKLRILAFLFDVVCANRIIWGAEEITEVSIRHTSGAPGRWVHEVMPQIDRMTEGSSANVLDPIRNAQRHALKGKSEVEIFLAKFFQKGEVSPIMAAHEADEHRPIENAWDCVVGATAYARGIPFTSDRVVVEQAAGSIIEAVR